MRPPIEERLIDINYVNGHRGNAAVVNNYAGREVADRRYLLVLP